MIGVGGLGYIGLQCLLATTAATITAVDVEDEALDLAAHHTVNPTAEDVADAVDSITDGARVQEAIDFVGADETTVLAPDVLAPGGDHHVVGYGGHVHEPSQTLVDGEVAYRGTLSAATPGSRS